MKKIIIGAIVCAFLGVVGFGADAMASNHRKKVDSGQSLKKHGSHQKNAGVGKRMKAGDEEDVVAVFVSDGISEDSDGVITHAISFEIWSDGDALRNAKTIKLTPPKSKKPAELKNGLGFDAVTFEADGLLEKDFLKIYPAGVYTVQTSPGGKITVQVDHDYPTAPDVTSPEDGEEDVSVTPTISWESDDEDIDGFYLYIEDEEGEVYYDEVPASINEYVLDEGVLEPDTDYAIYVGAFGINDDETVEVYSESLVEITTGAE